MGINKNQTPVMSMQSDPTTSIVSLVDHPNTLQKTALIKTSNNKAQAITTNNNIIPSDQILNNKAKAIIAIVGKILKAKAKAPTDKQVH